MSWHVSGVRRSQIRNTPPPEGVIFPVTAEEIGNQTLRWTLQTGQTKTWFLNKGKAGSATLSAPQVSFGVEGGEQSPWNNDLFYPQNLFVSATITRVRFFPTPSQNCAAEAHPKLRAGSPSGINPLQFNGAATTYPSRDPCPEDASSTWKSWTAKEELSATRLWHDSAGDSGKGHVLCERQKERPSETAACFGQGNCFLCMTRQAFVFD